MFRKFGGEKGHTRQINRLRVACCDFRKKRSRLSAVSCKFDQQQSLIDWIMCELYIGNLNADTTERELEDAFRAFGEVTRCHIGQSRNKDTPGTNFGFVTFTSPDSARDALDRLNGAEINRSHISVQYARRERDRYYRGGRDGRYRNGYDDYKRSYYGGGSRRSPYGSRRSPVNYRSRRSPGSSSRRSPYSSSRRSPYSSSRRRNGSPSDTQCYKCNGYGHIARYCSASSTSGHDRHAESKRYRRSRSRSM
ncbi:hypothetical protein GJ496_000508 [Pomphorhynchus laevis]|nr:hypothetical protein GJ496_000508 [Pomphorhynchus laevis]